MPSLLPTQDLPQQNYIDEVKSHISQLKNKDEQLLRNPFSSTRSHRLSLSENSKFLVCCFMWYLCSSLSSNTGKHIMNTFRYPVTLTFVQFLFVACWSAIVEKVANSSNIKKPTKIIVKTIVPLSLFMIVGHIFSSISISRIPVSLVHTIKVSED
jgi:hypothetical protein